MKKIYPVYALFLLIISSAKGSFFLLKKVQKSYTDYFSQLPDELIVQIITYSNMDCPNQNLLHKYTSNLNDCTEKQLDRECAHYFRHFYSLASVNKRLCQIMHTKQNNLACNCVNLVKKSLNNHIFNLIDGCLPSLEIILYKRGYKHYTPYESWKRNMAKLYNFKKYISDVINSNKDNRCILPSFLYVLLEESFNEKDYYTVSHVYLPLIIYFIECNCLVLYPSYVGNNAQNNPIYMSALEIVNTKKYSCDIIKKEAKYEKIAKIILKRSQLIIAYLREHGIKPDQNNIFSPEKELEAIRSTYQHWQDKVLPSILNPPTNVV
ncbi:hypothetical protein EKK58_07140 [Candidatus Dependentiae bacterium]|nr:MAG: hypothetical protein EKK58_07140 [Candidatus Dependentiae bacterium]